MVMFNHDINHRKSRIFVSFRFSGLIFGGHFKGQASRHICPVVFGLNVEHYWNFQKVWNQNSQAILRCDVLINKVILLFCLKYWGCVPLSQHAVRLIWTALSVPKGYCLDISTIVFCFSFNTKCEESFKSRVGYIVKVAFLLALYIYGRLSLLQRNTL